MPPKSTTKLAASKTLPKKQTVKPKKIKARLIKVLDDEVNKKGEIPSKKTKLDVQEEDKQKSQPSKNSTDKPTKEPHKGGPAKKKVPANDDSEKEEASKRAPNYKDDKDIELCRSWLEITKDQLNLTNKKVPPNDDSDKEEASKRAPNYKDE
ncbi:hypothetical protein PGT21_010102 [Puccinia graminis f. sp. tritici]|uniref:Uncharacterized protein n=1 Tax=Puccinia graminis f. sp. tritici TaxID=56615 RepID=A0A5B0QET0_PUCGR|nr:hypothetical protein PGT21_010102 [Puccinia graminis f. sp. tritici]